MKKKKENKIFKIFIIIAIATILILFGYEHFKNKYQNNNIQQAEQNVSQLPNEENKPEEKVEEEPKEDSQMKLSLIHI